MAIHLPRYRSRNFSQNYGWVWEIKSNAETSTWLHLSASDPKFEAKIIGKLRVVPIWLDVRGANTIRDRQFAERGGGRALR